MIKNIIVNGMSCNKCVAHVREALEELDNVNVLSVDLESKVAVVDSNVNVSDEDIKSILDEYGYEVESIETE